jgi:hypothetical protein
MKSPKVVDYDVTTGEVTKRTMTEEEFAQYEADLEASTI